MQFLYAASIILLLAASPSPASADSLEAPPGDQFVICSTLGLVLIARCSAHPTPQWCSILLESWAVWCDPERWQEARDAAEIRRWYEAWTEALKPIGADQ